MQSAPMDWGACLTMIMSCFGKQPNVNQIKMLCSLDRSGVSSLGMTDESPLKSPFFEAPTSKML